MTEKKKKRGFWKEAFRKRAQIRVIAGGHVLTDMEAFKGRINHAALISTDTPGTIDVSIGDKNRKTFTFNKIAWEQSGERSGGKAAVGAIVGTIAGPIGTIAGAAIGGRRKDTSTAFLYLTDEEGVEHEIHIECTKQLYAEIDRLPW